MLQVLRLWVAQACWSGTDRNTQGERKLGVVLIGWMRWIYFSFSLLCSCVIYIFAFIYSFIHSCLLLILNMSCLHSFIFIYIHCFSPVSFSKFAFFLFISCFLPSCFHSCHHPFLALFFAFFSTFLLLHYPLSGLQVTINNATKL